MDTWYGAPLAESPPTTTSAQSWRTGDRNTAALPPPSRPGVGASWASFRWSRGPTGPCRCGTTTLNSRCRRVANWSARCSAICWFCRADRADHAILQLGRRIGLREGRPGHRGGRGQLGGLLPASGAPLQVALHEPPLVLAQVRQGVLGQALPDRQAVHHRSLPALARRSLISVVRSRVLTVPSGMPSASAISRAVSPRK